MKKTEMVSKVFRLFCLFHGKSSSGFLKSEQCKCYGLKRVQKSGNITVIMERIAVSSGQIASSDKLFPLMMLGSTNFAE